MLDTQSSDVPDYYWSDRKWGWSVLSTTRRDKSWIWVSQNDILILGMVERMPGTRSTWIPWVTLNGIAMRSMDPDAFQGARRQVEDEVMQESKQPISWSQFLAWRSGRR